MIWGELQKVLRKITGVLTFCFEQAFGRDTKALKKLSALPKEVWGKIAHPHTLGNLSIAIFSYEHQSVQDAIYYIKNKRHLKIATSMCSVASDILLEELSELYLTENFTDPILVSVPTSRRRLIRRGFNPSEFIAICIKDSLTDLQLMTNALEKSKETKPQKQLSRTARLSNVKNSMRVRESYKKIISGRNIIVVDDVATTGSTLNEARRALLAAGAKKVLCLALAH